MRNFSRRVIALCLFFFAFTRDSDAQLVISQIYGAGGNTGATYNRDFIEIFNRGSSPVTATNWSVQYASSAGTTWQVTSFSATIAPGQYFLIGESSGANGIPLPTVDVSGTIAMAAASGKVALVNTNVALSGACPVGGATVVDFVGYGTSATCFEGTGTTGNLSTINSAIRINGGCTDNNNNSTDFSVVAVSPRNSATTPAPCTIPTVSVAGGLTAAEPATNGTFTLNLSIAAPAGGVTVTYTLTGSASLGSDYLDPQAGTITIGAGLTSGTITLNTTDDPDFEGTETINITLNTASAGYTITTGVASINLLDNDSPPTVSVAAGTQAAEPGTNGSFTLSLSSAAPAGGITVTYTLGGTASAGFDYTDPQSGSITISTGLTSGTINLTTLNDPFVEAIETIDITLNTVSSPYIIGTGAASINMTSDDFGYIPLILGTPYTQDFNTLAIAGTTNSLAIPGWLLTETGGGARDNELYAADNGGSGTGDTYSYGASAVTERALGGLQSGSLIPVIGSGYNNNTGVPITKLRVMYTGEQWRLGATGRNDRMDFQYSLDATSLSTGTWTDVNGLDFIAPNSAGSVGALNGNLAANQANISFEITGLSIPPGANFFIRWNDLNASGADDGLAIDNFSIEANPPDITPPSIVSLTPANGAANISLNTNTRIVFDEPVQKVAGNITLRLASDNSVVQTVDINNATVMINSTAVSLFLNNLSPNTGYYIEISNGALEDLSGNDFGGISGSSTWSFTTGTAFFVADFQGCNPALSDGFAQHSVTGAIVWACTSFGRDPLAPAGTLPYPYGVQINGFSGGTNVPNVDWLISPSFDLTGTTYPLLNFWSRTAFNGLPLSLKVSTNYTGGDPLLATWTDINGRFPAQTSNTWTLSQDINLTAFKQPNVHFAFVYTSSDEDGARWTLDDISLVNSPTPPPPSLTVGTTDIQFTYVAAGSSADKTFTFIGNDLTNDISLGTAAPFQISKDGVSFSSSLLYTVAEANNVFKTVHVRFSPAVQNQDFTGNISISSGSLSANVSLRGTSIDPVTTLEVVNWNLEWLGSPDFGPTNDNLQQANVQTIMQNIAADIFGVVEVVDETRLASIVSSMPGYSYVIGNFGSHVNPPDPTGGPLSEAQKLAFVYKTDLFSNITVRPLINNLNIASSSYYNWSSGRYPLLMSADLTQNCMTQRVHFVLIHAKANTSPTATSYARREAAANELRDTLNTYFEGENVLVLGDFNDDLDQSITAGFTITSYHSFMNDPNFYAPTLALSLAGKKSTVSYNDMIDHVIITDDLVPYYMSNSANVLNDVANLVSNYGSTTTDHYPVFTRYRFPNTVSPTSASCTEAVTFCASTTGTYTIPAFVASDDCDEILTYSYTITGATSRTGNSSDASGAFNTGTSVITWTASDSWGNTVNCVTTVTINANPTVTIPDAYALPSGVLPNTVYIGYAPASSITLTANAGGGAPGYTYSWTSGSLSASTTVSPLTNTTYTVTVTDQNNCQAMASKLITVMDIRGGHNLNKTIICHKPSQLNNTIVVNPADVANHLAHGDMLGACNAGASQLVTLGKETKEPLACLTVQAIPNPSNSAFALRIAGSGSHGMVTVKVTDMLGRLIETRTGIAADQVIRLGENYKPGFYMAAVSQGEETISVRLLKTR